MCNLMEIHFIRVKFRIPSSTLITTICVQFSNDPSGGGLEITLFKTSFWFQNKHSVLWVPHRSLLAIYNRYQSDWHSAIMLQPYFHGLEASCHFVVTGLEENKTKKPTGHT